jgi:hypothetical protein
MKRHTCSRDLYLKFLKVTCNRYSAFSLSEVSPIDLSHDAVSRWLRNSKCQPKDIWGKAKECVLENQGVLIADETVISKIRSTKIELVRYLYSGNEHDIVRGIGLLNFFWQETGTNGQSNPFDYRIYDPPEDGKTKNDHFRQMLKINKERGVVPEAVLADSWYSSLDNCKHIRDLGWNWVMGLRKNRIVNRGEKLEDLDIPKSGLRVHLRGYGWIHVFKFVSKNGRLDFIGTSLEHPTEEKVSKLVRMRWEIEVYHRELKQTCGLELCQARTGRAQRNHIGLSILCWIELAKQRAVSSASFYQQGWEIVKKAISKQLALELRAS